MSTEAGRLGSLSAMDGGPPPAPLQPLAILRRRRVPMIVAFCVAFVTAFIVAVAWPPTYVSSATILIEQQEMPLDLVRSTISSYADQRLQMINQRVMTTENLLRIIDRYSLYPKERRKKGRETIIGLMRNDMYFRTISADVIDPRQGKTTQATIAFSVGYKSGSPEAAAQVATELSSLYLEENLETRRRLTEETTNFLGEEAQKLSKRIAELDAQLAEFKEKHVNTVPQREPLNVQLLDRTDEQRRDIDTRIATIDQQLLYLDSQLAQINPASPMYTSSGDRVMSTSDRIKVLRTQYEQARALYAPDHPDVLRLKRQLEGMEKEAGTTAEAAASSANDRARQLEDARSSLAAAKQRYSADHPDVVKLERLVTSLEAAPPEPAAAAPAVADKPAEKPDNPVYIQLKTQREALTSERKSLATKQDDLVARAAELERRLESAPVIERQFVVIARELDNTQAKYREVRAKQMEAQLAQSLELERKGERFTLIEPALRPDEPMSPNRQLILTLGLILAAGASLMTALLLEVLDRSIRGPADVMNLLTAAPLAIVPWFENALELAARRRKQRYAMAAAGVALLAGVLLTHFLYRPLDLLWAQAVRRLIG